MRINKNETLINKRTGRENFKGAGVITKALYTLGNNDMLNASAVDIFAMDTPRTIVEFKHRGKNAGIEMGFREYTGTFIAEFSAAVFALLTSKVVSKLYKPEIKVNPNSWATDKSINTFKEIYEKSDKTVEGFVKNSLESMQGLTGKTYKPLKEASEEALKPLQEGLTKLIKDENLGKSEAKKLSESVKDGIINLIGADNNIIVKSGEKEFGANLSHVVRDMTELGKNVFFKKGGQGAEKITEKLKTLNKSRIALAIPASMALAITNQYINRKLTKKRTGIDNFVGENGYEDNVKNKKEKENQKGLLAKKAASAAGFVFMLSKVMGLKKPADLVNKLEFTGPATGGNAIKTIYGTLILGRIFASKDSTELRETTVRDYLGFLNWLVLGGFVAKGTAQIMDPKQKNLFNVEKAGKGVKHWLQDVSLKSQKEVIAQGGNVAKNLRKLNIAQLTGIAYSAVMLGVLLPKLNIAMTKRGKTPEPTQNKTFSDKVYFRARSINDFDNSLSVRS